MEMDPNNNEQNISFEELLNDSNEYESIINNMIFQTQHNVYSDDIEQVVDQLNNSFIQERSIQEIVQVKLDCILKNKIFKDLKEENNKLVPVDPNGEEYPSKNIQWKSTNPTNVSSYCYSSASS